MCLEEFLKGEELTGFFFGFLVSERSHDSTTDNRFDEFFISGRSANFSYLFKSPSCMYARSVAHDSRPSNMCVAYTIVHPLCYKLQLYVILVPK